MNEVKTAQEFPKDQHFAALEFNQDSIYHEGDERSRTNPGHGYPAYTEARHNVRYVPFKDGNEMKEWILKAEKQKASFKIVEVRPVQFTIKTEVEI